MKIAFLIPLIGIGGGERQLLSISRVLRKQGHSVEVFTSELLPNNLLVTNFQEVPVTLTRGRIGRNNQRGTEKMVNSVRNSRTLPRKLIEALVNVRYYSSFLSMKTLGEGIPSGFDIINCHNFPSEWAAFFAKKIHGVPTVWTCNEPPYWYYQESLLHHISWPLFAIWDKFVVNHIDRIVTLDRLNSLRVGNIYGRVPTMIRSGIDTEKFENAHSQASARRILGLSEHGFVLLQVGTLVPHKRYEDSIRALARVQGKLDSQLIIVGAGIASERTRLQELSKRFGVAKHVVFAGAVTDDELPLYYAACDALIFPAEQTWGLTVIEAMANGKPALVSAKSGVSEIIVDKSNGFIINPQQSNEVADKVIELAQDDARRAQVGARAREYAKTHFSWEKTATQYLSLFQNLRTIDRQHPQPR